MLANKVALVTGAAQGMGRVIAAKLAGYGALVFLADIQIESARDVAAGIRAEGGQAVAVEVDLTVDSSLEGMVAAIDAQAGRLDVLVNAAAPPRASRLPFPDNLAYWDSEMAILVRAPVMTVAKALLLLRKSVPSSVINIASVLADKIAQESAGYHTAKAGLVQFTRYLAYQEGASGIRANAVLPGVVDRDFAQKLTDSPDNKMVVEAAVPLGRAARSGDVAEVVAFLASDRASYVTGQALTVDGGLELGEAFHVGRKVLNLTKE
jgi:3-oxoacyl-[acyl-carrier protein] reductase